MAILHYYSQFNSDIIESAKRQANRPIEAILFIVIAYAECYENYPTIASISQSYDALQYNPKFSDKTKKMIHARELFVKTQIEQAKKIGLISPKEKVTYRNPFKHIHEKLLKVGDEGLQLF